MSDDEYLKLSENVKKLGNIFESKIGESFNRNTDDVVGNTASVAAMVFIYHEVRDTVVDITEQGAQVMFSYKEMLVDNCELPENVDSSVSKSKNLLTVKTYTWGKDSDSKNRNSWLDVNISVNNLSRSVSDAVFDSNTINSSTDTVELQVVDQELVQNFTDSLVNQIVLSSEVKIEESNNISTIQTESSIMTVEYEEIYVAQKGFLKKIKKVAAKVIPKIPVLGPIVTLCNNPDDWSTWLILGGQIGAITIMVLQPQLAPGVVASGGVSSTGFTAGFVFAF